jgi:hypothetical protein
MFLRLARLVIPAGIAALAWVGVCMAMGLPTAVTIAGAILAACGGVVAVAVCTVGAGQPEPVEPSAGLRPVRTVTAESQKRFDRDKERTSPGDRVA